MTNYSRARKPPQCAPKAAGKTDVNEQGNAVVVPKQGGPITVPKLKVVPTVNPEQPAAPRPAVTVEESEARRMPPPDLKSAQLKGGPDPAPKDLRTAKIAKAAAQDSHLPPEPELGKFESGDQVVQYMKQLAREAENLLPQDSGKKRRKEKKGPPLLQRLQESWGGMSYLQRLEMEYMQNGQPTAVKSEAANDISAGTVGIGHVLDLPTPSRMTRGNAQRTLATRQDQQCPDPAHHPSNLFPLLLSPRLELHMNDGSDSSATCERQAQQPHGSAFPAQPCAPLACAAVKMDAKPTGPTIPHEGAAQDTVQEAAQDIQSDQALGMQAPAQLPAAMAAGSKVPAKPCGAPTAARRSRARQAAPQPHPPKSQSSQSALASAGPDSRTTDPSLRKLSTPLVGPSRLASSAALEDYPPSEAGGAARSARRDSLQGGDRTVGRGSVSSSSSDKLSIQRLQQRTLLLETQLKESTDAATTAQQELAAQTRRQQQMTKDADKTKAQISKLQQECGMLQKQVDVLNNELREVKNAHSVALKDAKDAYAVGLKEAKDAATAAMKEAKDNSARLTKQLNFWREKFTDASVKYGKMFARLSELLNEMQQVQEPVL